MGKKNEVVKIMEKRLFSYGFKYEKYFNLSWIFSREVDGITQNVTIQRSQWSSAYILAIDVDDMQLRIREITDNDPKYPSDYLDFNNEEERCNVVNHIADIVIKYGIDKLNEKTIVKKNMVKLFEPTVQMYKKLYEENIELMQQFMSRNDAAVLTDEGILQLMKKELWEMKEKKYEEVQDKLVELSSMYGNMLIKKVGGRWKYNENDGIADLEIALMPSCLVLKNFIAAWQKGEGDLITKDYKTSCDLVINYVKECQEEYGESWRSKLIRVKWDIPL